MEAIFLKVINMSISAVWLILAVMVVRLALKKAPKTISVVLWGMVALRLLFPFSIESMLSLIPSNETVPVDIAMTNTPAIDSGVEVIDQAVNPILLNSFAPPADTVTSINPLQLWLMAGAIVWLAGIAAMMIYAVVSYTVLYVRVRASVKTDGNVFVCDDISGPFILGVIRPRIYVPSNLSGDRLGYVLAHERAHLKRLDHLWKPLGFLILAVHWFNPLVWVAYVLLCRDIEFACDERVIGKMGEEDIRSYSETLLECSVSRKMITACPIAFGEVGVKQRIKSVLNYKKPMFWVILVGVIVCVITAVFFLTSPPEEIDVPAGESGVSDGQSWFDAVVLENNKDRLLVSPCEGTNERSCSDKIYVNLPDNVTDRNGWEKDDVVRIYYDGVIQELYPAIIPNVLRIGTGKSLNEALEYEVESASAGFVRDKNDFLYKEADNAALLEEGSAPVHIAESFDEMEYFLERYGEEYGVILQKYDKAYFENGRVLLIYALESNRVGNRISKVGIIDGRMYVQSSVLYADNDVAVAPKCKIYAIGVSAEALGKAESCFAELATDNFLIQTPQQGNVGFSWKVFRIRSGSGVDSEADPYQVAVKDRSLYRFSSASALSRAGGYLGTLSQSPSVKANWYDCYMDGFFDTKELLVIYMQSPSGSINYEITNAGIDEDGVFCIDLLKHVPGVQDAAVKHNLIAVEVERSALKGCVNFKVVESDAYDFMPQENLVTYQKPEAVGDIEPFVRMRYQITGILTKEDPFYKNADNKAELGKEGVLPVKLVKNRAEYDSFMKRYAGIAGDELPDQGSMSYYSFSVYYPNAENVPVLLIYVDKNLAQEAEYTVSIPVVKDGMLTVPIVNDGWFESKIHTDTAYGWIIGIPLKEEQLTGISGVTALALGSAEEYAKALG